MTGTKPVAENITWHEGEVSRGDREKARGHRGGVIWLTGLSGSGKSTLGSRLEGALHARGVQVYVLDGDNVRHGLCADLGFAPDERQENVRRVGEVAKLFVDSGTLVISAFISPYRADRAKVRNTLGDGDFIEVHVAADLATCESRDPKGLYKKARAGEIKGFTGVDAPYEAPESPELSIDTSDDTPEESAARVLRYLEEQGYLSA